MRRFIILALVLFASAAAAAQPGNLDQAERERTLQAQRRDRAAAQAQELRDQIAVLSQQLESLAVDQAKGGDAVEQGRSRLDELNSREADLAARAGANQTRLARLLGALQMFGAHPPPALFVHPEDARAAVRAAILIRAVTPELKSRADGYAAEIAALGETRRAAAAQAESLFTTESQVADRGAEIERVIAEKRDLETRLNADVEAADRDIAALSARIQTLRARAPAGPAPKGRSPGAAPDQLGAPVAGKPTRRFGDRDARGGRVEGWVWSPGAGTRVASPASGLVEYAGALEGWDDVLIMNIGDGYHLVLAGVGALNAKAGDQVQPGQTVASMGSAEGNLAPELYLEVRKDGKPVDPARFFAAIAR